MIREDGTHIVQSLAVGRADGNGYIVVFDANDLSEWLRSGHPGLSEVELDLCDEIANVLDVWAIQTMHDHVDLDLEE